LAFTFDRSARSRWSEIRRCRSLSITEGSLVSVGWVTGTASSIAFVPLDGGPVRSLETATPAIGGALAVSNAAVYSLGWDESYTLSHVVRTPLDGGPAQTLASLPSDGPLSAEFQSLAIGALLQDIALAADGTLYWNTSDRILYMKVE
jgi:hypothetical protein